MERSNPSLSDTRRGAGTGLRALIEAPVDDDRVTDRNRSAPRRRCPRRPFGTGKRPNHEATVVNNAIACGYLGFAASQSLSHLCNGSVPVKSQLGQIPCKPLSDGTFRRFRVGFESSHGARRRLAALASSNGRVQEALSASAFSGFWGNTSQEESRQDREAPLSSGAELGVSQGGANGSALVRHLDDLAQDIVAIPGAGGALLAAYAAQARALAMVVEAAKRAGSAPLPASVLMAAQDALSAPSPMPRLVIG